MVPQNRIAAIEEKLALARQQKINLGYGPNFTDKKENSSITYYLELRGGYARFGRAYLRLMKQISINWSYSWKKWPPVAQEKLLEWLNRVLTPLKGKEGAE